MYSSHQEVPGKKSTRNTHQVIRIGRYLQQHHIEGTFNPPASSHFCGFWERLIRYVRRIMYSLHLLQKRQQWVKPQRNVKVGDIVLTTDNTPRNAWNMGRVTEVHTDHKGLVRVVTLKTSTTVLQRLIHKLYMLLGVNE